MHICSSYILKFTFDNVVQKGVLMLLRQFTTQSFFTFENNFIVSPDAIGATHLSQHTIAYYGHFHKFFLRAKYPVEKVIASTEVTAQ